MPSTSLAPSATAVSESIRERNNRIVKELADRVVKGWTLLNTTCPTCQTALLRSREGQVYCVGCRMPVVTEAEARQRNLASLPEPATAAIASAPVAPLTTTTTPTPSASPATPQMPSPEPPPSRASSFATSSPFSLNRSNALSASAPPREEARAGGEQRQHPQQQQPPLVSLSSSPHFAELNAQLQELNGAATRASHESEASGALSSLASVSSGPSSTAAASPRIQRQTERTNVLSARLGAKMMQGWTLMGVHCADDTCLVWPRVHRQR